MGQNNYLFPRPASTALFTLVPSKFTQFQRCNSTAVTAKLLEHKAAAEHLATQGGEDYSQEYCTRKGTQPGIETLPRGVALSTSHDAVQKQTYIYCGYATRHEDVQGAWRKNPTPSKYLH